MQEATQNWFVITDKELKLAELALQADEPIGVIYHLHAAVEKTLKGIHEETIGNPPKIHALKKLAIECCSLPIQEKELELLDLLDKAFIDSRYPKNVHEFENEYNINSCIELVKQTRGMIKCLKDLMNRN